MYRYGLGWLATENEMFSKQYCKVVILVAFHYPVSISTYRHQLLHLGSRINRYCPDNFRKTKDRIWLKHGLGSIQTPCDKTVLERQRRRGYKTEAPYVITGPVA